MAELLAAIEDAETVLMPYITAKEGVIQDAVIEAAARSKEDLPNNGKPRQPLLVDLASTNSRHEGTGESRGLNRPGDTGKGGRPATHEPGREMNESIPAGDEMVEESLAWDPFGCIGEDDLQVRFEALKQAGETVPPGDSMQSTAIALGKGVRGGEKGSYSQASTSGPRSQDKTRGQTWRELVRKMLLASSSLSPRSSRRVEEQPHGPPVMRILRILHRPLHHRRNPDLPRVIDNSRAISRGISGGPRSDWS
jgi:hypothetical protein